MRAKQVLVGLAWVSMVASAAAPLWAGTVYKWVDGEGQTHYSQSPPPDLPPGEVQQLKGPPGVDTEAARQALEADEAAFAARRAAAAEQATERAAAEREREARDLRCAELRASLERLRNAQRVYDTDASGQRVRLPEEDRQARIAETEARIAKECS